MSNSNDTTTNPVTVSPRLEVKRGVVLGPLLTALVADVCRRQVMLLAAALGMGDRLPLLDAALAGDELALAALADRLEEDGKIEAADRLRTTSGGVE